MSRPINSVHAKIELYSDVLVLVVGFGSRWEVDVTARLGLEKLKGIKFSFVVLPVLEKVCLVFDQVFSRSALQKLRRLLIDLLTVDLGSPSH